MATDYSEIDTGIRNLIRSLNDAGVVTMESCQGGPGHPYPAPWIRIWSQNTRQEIKDAAASCGRQILRLRYRTELSTLFYGDDDTPTHEYHDAWNLYLKPWPELGYSLQNPVRRITALTRILLYELTT